jgi:hypothetical protein
MFVLSGLYKRQHQNLPLPTNEKNLHVKVDSLVALHVLDQSAVSAVVKSPG